MKNQSRVRNAKVEGSIPFRSTIDSTGVSANPAEQSRAANVLQNSAPEAVLGRDGSRTLVIVRDRHVGLVGFSAALISPDDWRILRVDVRGVLKASEKRQDACSRHDV